MNNLKPYNLSSFNISQSAHQEDIDLAMYCYEKYQTTITFSKNSIINVTCSEKVVNKTQLALAIDEPINLYATLNLKSNLIAYVVVEVNNNEKIIIDSNVYLNISDKVDSNETIGLRSHGVSNISFDVTFDENININPIDTALDLKMQNCIISENLITNFNSAVLSNLISSINVNLSKGQILEIDSDKFTVYLDDTNILDKFTGDWVNISRDVEAIEVSSLNKGKLKGKLIFRERFL